MTKPKKHTAKATLKPITWRQQNDEILGIIGNLHLFTIEFKSKEVGYELIPHFPYTSKNKLIYCSAIDDCKAVAVHLFRRFIKSIINGPQP